MSTGLAIFDTTVQESNAWLKALQTRLPDSSRQQSYAALRASLHVLRDRLPMEAVLSLSAQMPLLLRGVLLEGWRPQDGPSGTRDPMIFAEVLADLLPAPFPFEAGQTLRAVLSVMTQRLGQDEMHKLAHCLPEPLRAYWPAESWTD